MKDYKPAEHSDTSNVAPLVQFFELVHIGDTIQSIMQVYFDKELVGYRTLALTLAAHANCTCRPPTSIKQTF